MLAFRRMGNSVLPYCFGQGFYTGTKKGRRSLTLSRIWENESAPDDRRTARITSWKPCRRKRSHGRPGKRWRDEIDTFWKDNIWQRGPQDRQTWKWRTTKAHSSWTLMMMTSLYKRDTVCGRGRGQWRWCEAVGENGITHASYRLRGWVVKGVGHLDHVWSYGVREVVSSIPDRGNIVGWVFHPTQVTGTVS